MNNLGNWIPKIDFFAKTIVFCNSFTHYGCVPIPFSVKPIWIASLCHFFYIQICQMSLSMTPRSHSYLLLHTENNIVNSFFKFIRAISFIIFKFIRAISFIIFKFIRAISFIFKYTKCHNQWPQGAIHVCFCIHRTTSSIPFSNSSERPDDHPIASYSRFDSPFRSTWNFHIISTTLHFFFMASHSIRIFTSF